MAGPAPGPFVGRDEPLTRLRDVFTQRPGHPDTPAVVAITGAPGLGKTRLVDEFLARLDAESRHPTEVLRVQPPARVSYGLWGALLEALLERVASLDPAGGDADAAFAALAGTLDGEPREQFLSQRAVVDLLVGRDVDDRAAGGPQQMGDRIQVAVTLCLSAAARLLGQPSHPLVIALDNLHRADPASMALLPKLVPGIRAEVAPFFLLTTRGALPEELPDDVTIIALRPLSSIEAASVAGAVAGASVLSPAVQQIVAERSGGNPLFIEQLVAMLREEGRLGASVTQLRSLAPPVSLYGLFLERVDRLEPELGDALRLGSVLGGEFEREVFIDVHSHAVSMPGSTAPAWEPSAALDELVARGFLAPLKTADGDLYAFEPAHMQAAVYGTVLLENRRILHALGAEAVERFHADRPARYLARILHHYSQSGNVDRTVHYARLAGDRALSMAAYDEATEHLETAVALQDRASGTTDDAAAETLHHLALACCGAASCDRRSAAWKKPSRVWRRAHPLRQTAGVSSGRRNWR